MDIGIKVLFNRKRNVIANVSFYRNRRNRTYFQFFLFGLNIVCCKIIAKGKLLFFRIILKILQTHHLMFNFRLLVETHCLIPHLTKIISLLRKTHGFHTVAFVVKIVDTEVMSQTDKILQKQALIFLQNAHLLTISLRYKHG